jgi:hypothetical protein
MRRWELVCRLGWLVDKLLGIWIIWCNSCSRLDLLASLLDRIINRASYVSSQAIIPLCSSAKSLAKGILNRFSLPQINQLFSSLTRRIHTCLLTTGKPRRLYSFDMAAAIAVTASPVCSKSAQYNSRKSIEIARFGWLGAVGKNPRSMRSSANGRHWHIGRSID